MTKKRRSTEGVRWAFMKRYPIRDLEPPHDLYLWRLRVIQTPWFAVYLHKICRPDTDRHLHDHPFPFASLVLSGGYEEEYSLHTRGAPDLPPVVIRGHRRGRLNVMGTGAVHRITCLYNGPAWTLVFCGPRTHDWGFWVDGEWIDHETYFRLRAGEQI